MIAFVLGLLLLGVLLAVVRPYVEPVIFNLAIIIVVICVIYFLWTQMGGADIPFPHLRR